MGRGRPRRPVPPEERFVMTKTPRRPGRDTLLALGCLAALGLGACSRGALEEAVTSPADAAIHAGGIFDRPP